MVTPKLSIGLPVYNGEKYVSAALESLLDQDFEDFELIISDNASTDATEEICRNYAARDPRVRYYRNVSNLGSARNYRRVFELARGELFKWVAHDDLYHQRLLGRCVEVFESAQPSVVLAYPRVDLIDEHGKVLGRAPDSVECMGRRPYVRFAHVLLNVSYAYPVFGLARAECLRKTRLTGAVPYWDETLLAELALYGEIVEIPEVLAQQRCHPGNAVTVVKANRLTRLALRMWTDPSQPAPRIWLPNHEEHYWEFAKRVHHAPLSLFERLVCYGAIIFVCYWSGFRKTGGRWRRRLRERLRTARTRQESYGNGG